MPVIHNRLDPANGDISRAMRRYNLAEIAHALELAEQIGTKQAARETGIPYRRLVRLRLADRRSRMTLSEALDALDSQPIFQDRTGRRPHPSPWTAAAQAAREKADLILRVEAAREGHQVSKRTGTNLWKCLAMAAERRGLRGKSLCELVREGRIAKHWLT